MSLKPPVKIPSAEALLNKLSPQPLSGSSNGFRSNEVETVTPQCKVILYNWATESLKLDSGASYDSKLAETLPLDISSQIMSVSFSKTIGNPSGTFNITLPNTPNLAINGVSKNDWKDIIKRGTWLTIYMTQRGDLKITPKVDVPDMSNRVQESKYLRCIGYIDRVSVRGSVDDKKAFDAVFEISGRDFGVIYEDTDIWHDVFYYETSALDAIKGSGLNVVGTHSINKVLKTVHDLFFNPKAIKGAKVNDKGSLLRSALQWIMPNRMLKDIGLSPDKNPYWGEQPVTKFANTQANMAVSNPTDYLKGNAWENLKNLSIPQLHELYTELNESGKPELVFRPLPFAIDKTKYPTVGKSITSYLQLPAIEVSSKHVLDFDLGEDNHNRYNSFLLTIVTSKITIEDNLASLKSKGFPKQVQDSIKRHGFRKMHSSINALVKNAEKNDGKANDKIMQEYNEYWYDIYNNLIFAESGQIGLIGNPEVRVGKCVKFDKTTPYMYGKRYYIEGYTDTFMVDEKRACSWTQTLMVTHGYEEDDLRSKRNFGERDTKFTNSGEFTEK